MGSSCFSRGNKRLLALVQSYLAENGLKERVRFKGAHCMGKCEKGPVLMIDDNAYFHVDQAKVLDLLDELFRVSH